MTNDNNALSLNTNQILLVILFTPHGVNRKKENVKIAVPLKYLSNFWRSLEMPLINCKVELSLKWYERCLLTAATTATFKITDAKLYVPIVTLSVEDNSKLTKLLNEGFKRPIHWNEYKVTPNKIVEIVAANDKKYIRELFDSSCQGVNRLFVLAYDNTARNNQVSVDFYKKYFLPRVKINNCNIEIDGRNFYDQPVNDSIKEYDEVRKISTGKSNEWYYESLKQLKMKQKNKKEDFIKYVISMLLTMLF